VIIEEDVMLPEQELLEDPYLLTQAEDKKRSQPLFAEFLDLDMEEQKDVMILIDLIANILTTGVPDMAFPFGFRSVGHWNELFTSCGFKTKDVLVTGFQEGLFNRSSHVYFILERN
jgi:hypothetical protein